MSPNDSIEKCFLVTEIPNRFGSTLFQRHKCSNSNYDSNDGSKYFWNQILYHQHHRDIPKSARCVATSNAPYFLSAMSIFFCHRNFTSHTPKTIDKNIIDLVSSIMVALSKT